MFRFLGANIVFNYIAIDPSMKQIHAERKLFYRQRTIALKQIEIWFESIWDTAVGNEYCNLFFSTILACTVKKKKTA